MVLITILCICIYNIYLLDSIVGGEKTSDDSEIEKKKKDKTKIISFYEELLKQHGDTPQAFDWGSKKSQINRFKVLIEGFDLEGKKLLDVGCGTGDLYGFLISLEIKNFGYTGIDISERMIKQAREKFPNANFIKDDFLKRNFNGDFDIVFVSGTFNYKCKDHLEFLKKAIKKIYKISNIGVGFNLTSTYVDSEYKTNHTYYADPEKIFSFCKSISKWVTLRHDYAPHDFTIYLYKYNKYDRG